MEAQVLDRQFGNECLLGLRGGIQPMNGVRLYFSTSDPLEATHGYLGLPGQWQRAVQVLTDWLKALTPDDQPSSLEIMTDPSTGYTALQLLFGRGFDEQIITATDGHTTKVLSLLAAALEEEVVPA